MRHKKYSNHILSAFGEFIALAVIVTALVFVLNCCATSRHTETEILEEKTAVNYDSLMRTRGDSIRKVYDEKLRQANLAVDFYRDNEETLAGVITALQSAIYDSTVSADSLRRLFASVKCPPAKVVYKSSGDVEVTGPIKSINAALLELNKKMDSVAVTKESTTDLHKEMREEKKAESMEKKRGVSFIGALFKLWWLLLAAYVFGVLFPPKKIISLLKKLRP
jgi:hypothetical protein